MAANNNQVENVQMVSSDEREMMLEMEWMAQADCKYFFLSQKFSLKAESCM